MEEGEQSSRHNFLCRPGKWPLPDADRPNALEAVNGLALRYALAPDGAAKEGMLHDILKLFYGYVMKYVTMIVDSTLPPQGSPAFRDSKLMLRTLIPRGQATTEEGLCGATRMLHRLSKARPLKTSTTPWRSA